MSFDLFMDIFSYRENGWSRLDPRMKLATALVAIACILVSNRAILPLAVFGLCLAAMVHLRIPLKLLLARLAFPAGMVLMLILLMAFTQGEKILVTFAFWGANLPMREEGLLRGMLTGSRVMGAVGVVLLLSTVTPAHKIFIALRWFRIPAAWIEIAMLMYRYVFCLLDRAVDTAEAQRVRLGYLGMRRSLNSLATLAGAVLLGSLDQAQKTQEAMLMRGYSGAIPLGSMPGWKGRDIAIGLAATAGLTAVYLILEWS